MRRSARLSSSTNTEPTQPDWLSGTVQGEGCGTTCLRLRGDTDFGKASAVDFARLGNHTTRLCESMDFVFRHLRFWCTAETCPGAAYLMHKRGEWTAPFWNKDNAGASGFDLLLRAVVILKTQKTRSRHSSGGTLMSTHLCWHDPKTKRIEIGKMLQRILYCKQERSNNFKRLVQSFRSFSTT